MDLDKSKAFAQNLLELASNEGLTVGELQFSLRYMARQINKEINQRSFLICSCHNSAPACKKARGL